MSSDINWNNKTKKFWWDCEKGHSWETTPASRVIHNSGCLVCLGKQTVVGVNDLKTLFPGLAKEWHPTKNGVLLPENFTVSSGKTAWWQCNKGHEWETYIYARTLGNGCLVCSYTNFSSAAELNIGEYLTQNLHQKIERNLRTIVKKHELDIYVPEKKIAIEYNGLYWHSEKFKPKNYHYDKWLACKEQGIQLIQVWEDEWNRNPELVKRMLAQKIGMSTDPKIFARNSLPKKVSKETAEIFLNINHIQGFASGSYYLGLFDKRDIEKLVAVLVLKKEPGTNGKTLNIIRYATSQNVVGGFTKLLSYAEKTYKPKSFVTFSDNCVSDGGLYENNGFIADKNLAPDYTYLVKGERKHKFGYRLKRFRNDPELQYRPGLTERELAALNGLPRVWDAGKTRWVKNTM